jgi:hypothetical protein
MEVVAIIVAVIVALNLSVIVSLAASSRRKKAEPCQWCGYSSEMHASDGTCPIPVDTRAVVLTGRTWRR